MLEQWPGGWTRAFRVPLTVWAHWLAGTMSHTVWPAPVCLTASFTDIQKSYAHPPGFKAQNENSIQTLSSADQHLRLQLHLWQHMQSAHIDQRDLHQSLVKKIKTSWWRIRFEVHFKFNKCIFNCISIIPHWVQISMFSAEQKCPLLFFLCIFNHLGPFC